MQKQTVDFYIELQEKVVQKVGRSIMLTPKIVEKDREMKWYSDKLKDSN